MDVIDFHCHFSRTGIPVDHCGFGETDRALIANGNARRLLRA